MTEFIKKYAHIWGGNPKLLMDKYDYQPQLTRRLDELDPIKLDRESVYEIILWKLNRFPDINNELIRRLASVSSVDPGNHREAEPIVRELLSCHGIRLPMASTLLRFVNPKTFQIIDDRAYRVLFPGKKICLTKPKKITESFLKKSADIYFEYLDGLLNICNDNLPFSLADRILYRLDIELGNKIGD